MTPESLYEFASSFSFSILVMCNVTILPLVLTNMKRVMDRVDIIFKIREHCLEWIICLDKWCPRSHSFLQTMYDEYKELEQEDLSYQETLDHHKNFVDKWETRVANYQLSRESEETK